jgi:TonB-linked SusC/RagA family outer membrane protein
MLYGQSKISGRIYSDDTKEPVSGATITLKVAGRQTISGLDGTFLLTAVNLNDTLLFRYLGFKLFSLPLNQPSHLQNLDIRLEREITSLNEVVVSTGYQNLPKERSTGSFVQLNNQKLNEQVSTGILSRLEAVTSGLTFDRTTSAAPQISIRGLSTINGPKSPLIVVDNFPYEGNINNINPNDVESVTVLKDAAAASIWGTRAGNGVIVITTKKAKYNQPLSVDFNANLTINRKPDLYYLRPMSSGDFIDVEQLLFKNGYYNNQIADPAHPALTPAVELLVAARNGTIAQNSAEAQINALRTADVRNDFNKYMYHTGVNQQYALSLKGGSATQSWLFSGGYDQNVSTLSAGYNRYSARFQNSFTLLKKLQMTTGITYTQSISTNGRPGYGDVRTNRGAMYPYERFADENGNALPVNVGYSQSYLATAGNGKLLNWNYYPLTDYQHTANNNNIQDVLANIAAKYQLFKFLDLNVQYQYERQNNSSNNLSDENSYAARSLVNQFTQISSTGAVTYTVPRGGLLDLASQLIESQNLRGQLNFNHTWKKHEINAIAGTELRQLTSDGNSNRLYGYNPELLTFGNVDLTKTYPTFVTGENAFIPETKNLTGTSNRFLSLFTNAAYTYDRKYTFSISGRRDASNLFGVNTNNRWNPLGSLGLAWNLSEESFYKLSFLPYLKLRATYGISGNVDLARTAVTTIEYLGNSPFTQTLYARYVNYANPDLKWENIAMLNLAADFSLLNNRISGSIEYYRKNAKDLYGNALIDYTTGIGSTITKNVARMKGNGIDLILNTVNINGQFKWSTNFNLSFYKNAITAYYIDNSFGNAFVGSYPVISGIVGKPVYSVLSFRSAGLDPQTGDPRGYLNGQVSKDYNALYYNAKLEDLIYSGSALPTKFGSVGNTFNWQNAFLSFVVTYKFGYYFKKTSIDYSALFANGLGNADYAHRWQKQGDELNTTVPSLVYPASIERDAFYSGSDVLVEKGDHIRLQYITAGYEFSKKNNPRLPFKSIQLYTNINNLGILWRANKSGIDPDYNYSASTLKPPLTVSFGIKASL